MAQFQIKNLTFKYPLGSDDFSLKNINLEIEKGDYVVLLGKSGCGKTTLLKHLKPTLMPSGKREGEILFNGKDIWKLSLRDETSLIGYVMQSPEDQIVTDKVWHELAFSLENLGYDSSLIRLRVSEMASYFGISDWFYKDVATLSGGQKQLLNLASIMAINPEVLILDEPTSQLDPISANDFLNTLKKINRELGTTIILSEHRLEEVLPSCDKAIIMDQGEIIEEGNPRHLGRTLYEKKMDVFKLMSSPTRMFYDLGGVGDTPLNVREGRRFLDSYLKDKDLKYTVVSEEDADFDSMEMAVKLDEVWYKYSKDERDVIRGLNLRIPKGKIFAIVGGNGTGKSTTLKLISGIFKPYKGKIEIFGKNISKYKGNDLYTNLLTMLPQNPRTLFVKDTVYDELLEMCNDKDEIDRISKLCEIDNLYSSNPLDISGGELERVGLCKVLLTKPKLILLDEPTKGLDNIFKEKFAGILKSLKDEGITILMVTHDIEFSASYSDYVGMFFNGELITMGEPRKFFANSSFYTTKASRMARHIYTNAITVEDIVNLCKMNQEN